MTFFWLLFFLRTWNQHFFRFRAGKFSCAAPSKDLVVDCACVVEECTNDALDSLDAFFGKRRTVGFVVVELGVLAIDDFTDCTWRGHSRCSLA